MHASVTPFRSWFGPAGYNRERPGGVIKCGEGVARKGPRAMRRNTLPVSRRRSCRAVAAAVVVLPQVLAIAIAGCGQPSPAPATASPRAPAAATPAASSPLLPHGRVIAGSLAGPDLAITTTGIYLAWFASPPASGVRTELARIDGASGRIVAARHLGPVYFDQAVAAGGSLWVATSSGAGETLVRLDPRTLAVTGRRPVGGGGNQGFSGHVLAVSGGGLWVAGGDRLLRLSVPAGAVTASLPLPAAATSQVAADSPGTVLVVAETTSTGSGILQRRDPATGALLATSPAVPGVTGLFVGGVVGSGVWVSNATGMMGYAERFDARTLVPSPGTRVEGTNGITVQVADGLAWVSPGAGGPGLGFCADPSSGRVLARLMLPQPDRLLAIGPGQLFYAAPAPDESECVEQEPLPGGCRAG